MPDTSWLPPLVKALTTALLVVSAAALAEALGPFWGAIVATLPISTGPAYAFLALQHSTDFLADSALSSLAANAASALFLLSYGLLARQGSAAGSLAAAVAIWLLAAASTELLTWSAPAAVLLNVATFGPSIALLNPASTAAPPAQQAPLRWLDIPIRAIAAALFVTIVLAVGAALGPRATGLAAVFPIGLTTLFAVIRPRIGGPATALLAANALRSMPGFAAMLLAFHLTVRPWGVPAALALGLLVSALWSATLLLLRTRRRLA